MKKGNLGELAERKYCLYVHTTPSKKKYVGITNREPHERWRKDGKGYRSNTYFYNAIQKYGWDNIDHNILADNLTEEEAIKAEMELIAKLQTTDREHGYNHSLGGECPSNNMADVESYRMKQAMITHQLWQNPEFRKKQLESIGRKAPPKNTKPSNARKAVLQYTKDGEFVARYDCLRHVAEHNGWSIMSISRCCNGIVKQAHGFIFKFENPEKAIPGRGVSTRRAIIQYSLDGTLIARFSSIKEALQSLGFGTYSTIIGACTGYTKTAYGFRWSYEEG